MAGFGAATGQLGSAVGTSNRIPVTPSYISWGDPTTDPPASLGWLGFDVIISEEHSRAAVITDHSVEEGINIVDNVRPLPDYVELEVLVSNSPINSTDATRAAMQIDIPQPGQGGFLAGGTGALIGNVAAALSGPEGDPNNPTSSLQRFLGFTGGLPTTLSPLVDQFAGDQDYVRNAYTTLTALRDTATLLSVLTPRATYTNMLIETIKMHRDASTGTSARMSIEFRQVRIVSSSVVDAPQPSVPRGQNSVSKGNSATTAPTGPMTSVAKTATDSAGLTVAGSGQ